MNFCSEVSTPPPLWGFCLINLWSSSLSHPQARPAGREFTFWQGETEARCQILDVPQSSLVTPVFISSQDSVPSPWPKAIPVLGKVWEWLDMALLEVVVGRID